MKESLIKAAKMLWSATPILLGAVLLVSLAQALIPDELLAGFFQGSPLLDSFIGAFLGSFMAGNPLISYVLSGELSSAGVSLFAVTSFLLSWVTVGLVQLPAEALMLGKRFAIIRNVSAFFLSIACAFVTVWVVSAL